MVASLGMQACERAPSGKFLLHERKLKKKGEVSTLSGKAEEVSNLIFEKNVEDFQFLCTMHHL